MKTVGIYPNRDKDTLFNGTASVVNVLSGEMRILMDESLRGELYGKHDEKMFSEVEFVSEDRLFSEPEALITLGGDGTILKAARRCAPMGVPIVGINLGRVGFMAELELDELYLLQRLAEDKFTLERRMLLEADIGGRGTFALNDAVLGGESIFRMVEIELYCGSRLVTSYRADGLIASTPTGSTAYSLSAGGAVVDPCMDAIMMTPICSHSLYAVPILFSAESELIMKNVSRRENKLILSVDGCENYALSYGESVRIRRSPMRANFIRLGNGGFYEVLRQKMTETV